MPRWIMACRPRRCLIGRSHYTPPQGAYGIVRPTKFCIKILAEKYDWIFRLNWDAELIHSTHFERLKHLVYGDVAINRMDKLVAPLEELGIKIDRLGIKYLDGPAILASSKWWTEIYGALPESVTHLCEDSVSSHYGTKKGYHLVDMPLAVHRHNEWRHPINHD